MLRRPCIRGGAGLQGRKRTWRRAALKGAW
jgi:hypothetical protein